MTCDDTLLLFVPGRQWMGRADSQSLHLVADNMCNDTFNQPCREDIRQPDDNVVGQSGRPTQFLTSELILLLLLTSSAVTEHRWSGGVLNMSLTGKMRRRKRHGFHLRRAKFTFRIIQFNWCYLVAPKKLEAVTSGILWIVSKRHRYRWPPPARLVVDLIWLTGLVPL